MRWYLDTEFNEDGRTIELISLALVSQVGHKYYAHSADYDPEACNPWVKQNVLPFLKDKPRIPRHQIASDIRRLLVGNVPPSRPEIWAYFADYDWVAFCQLYGPMVNLPDFFPKYCRDLKQLMDERGIHKAELPPQAKQHDALDDAEWNRASHEYILSRAA